MSGPKTQEEIERLANWYDSNSTAETEAGGWLEGEVADEPMSVRSIRLPVETSRRVAKIAEGRGLRQTELMRDWIEQCLAAEESGSGLDVVRATIADAIRAIADVGRRSGVVVSVDFASNASGKPGGVAEIHVSEEESRTRRPRKSVPTKTAAKQAAVRKSGAKKLVAKRAAPVKRAKKVAAKRVKKVAVKRAVPVKRASATKRTAR
jgi:predicted transcriptional regulator